ncbi:Mss4-like protein [Lasiosphaeris hirsuta]|uniref:Mss4-like protein n=1 Tax=Lasiosphaeris hirsuta TaxID=260670 RepID=A0AA40AGW1_9PEZI|nr:Mss4-like protein [Lasiosphaeris hirsuta]
MTITPDPVKPGLPVSCQCGDIRFSTPPGGPLFQAICHCTNCRKQTTSAFGMSVFFPSDKVFPLPAEVEAKIKVFEHGCDSGNTMRCFFCPRCGVRVLQAAIKPDGSMRPAVSFRAGAIDSGIEWPWEGTHFFTRSAVIPIPEKATKFETLPPPEE